MYLPIKDEENNNKISEKEYAIKINIQENLINKIYKDNKWLF